MGGEITDGKHSEDDKHCGALTAELFMNCKSKILCAIALLLPLTVHAEVTAVEPAQVSSCYQIDSLANLRWVSENSGSWSSCFVQTKDIDASETSGWNSGLGLSPIGDWSTSFTGSYDGQKYTIRKLTIITSSPYAGLFGIIDQSAFVKSLGLTDAVVTSSSKYANVGVIAGVNEGTITECYATGTDSSVSSGHPTVGGLVGSNMNTIRNSYTDVTVYASTSDNDYSYAGGLVGNNTGIISDCYTKGTTTAISMGNGSTTQALSGGIVGMNSGNSLSKCYAMGKASASTPNCAREGAKVEGALIGLRLSSENFIGFWNKATGGSSACENCTGAVGLDSASMFQSSNFTGFDYDSIWFQYNGQTTPILRAFMTPLTITAKDTTKFYDGSAFNGDNGVSYSLPSVDNHLIFGSLKFSGTHQGAIDTGTYTINIDGLWSTQHGYLITFINGKLRINPKALSLASLSIQDKVYDGNTSATVIGSVTLNGIVPHESVALSTGTISAYFENKNVGTNKLVTITGYGLVGSDASHYTIDSSAFSAGISAKPISILSDINGDKIYDGTTVTTLSGGTFVDTIATDILSITGSGTFADKNVGTDQTVTVTSLILTGNDAGNYLLNSQPTTIQAKIVAKSLTVKGVITDDKVYDGTVSATVHGGALEGVYANDTVSLTLGNASFANSRMESNKTVTVAGSTLHGRDSANYTINSEISASTATITARPITLAGVTASDKVYDGNNNAAVSGGTFVDTIAGDSLRLVVGANLFANKNVGSAKTITTSYTLGGKDSANYSLSQPTSLTANITPRPLTISGVTAADKVYDGTTTATLSSGTLDAITGDDVALVAGSGSFSDANVGTAKTATASGYSIAGNDASNYTLSAQPTGLTASITPKTIHIAANKDTIAFGAASPTLTYVADSLLAGDSLTGALTREVGDTAGTYVILIGTLSAGGNYTIDFASANVVITAPESIHTNAPSIAFTGRTNAKIFNLQGKQVWSGSLDVINGQVQMPSIGEGRWVVKLQMENIRNMNTTVR